MLIAHPHTHTHPYTHTHNLPSWLYTIQTQFTVYAIYSSIIRTCSHLFLLNLQTKGNNSFSPDIYWALKATGNEKQNCKYFSLIFQWNWRLIYNHIYYFYFLFSLNCPFMNFESKMPKRLCLLPYNLHVLI